MMERSTGIPVFLCAVSLLAAGASVSAEERVIPGETYTADLIGPSVVDSFAQRRARGVDPGLPPAGGPYEVPRRHIATRL